MCDAYKRYSSHKFEQMELWYFHASMVSIFLLAFGIVALLAANTCTRNIFNNVDNLGTLQLLMFATMYGTASLTKPFDQNGPAGWVVSATLSIAGTWGCLLSSVMLSYNVQVTSKGLDKLEKFNNNRYRYSIAIWIIAFTVAFCIDMLHIVDIKPVCLSTLLEFIVCLIAIRFFIISMYNWYTDCECKVVVWDMVQYLIVTMICFVPQFMTKSYDYFVNDMTNPQFIPTQFYRDLLVVTLRSLYGAFIGVLVLLKLKKRQKLNLKQFAECCHMFGAYLCALRDWVILCCNYDEQCDEGDEGDEGDDTGDIDNININDLVVENSANGIVLNDSVNDTNINNSGDGENQGWSTQATRNTKYCNSSTMSYSPQQSDRHHEQKPSIDTSSNVEPILL